MAYVLPVLAAIFIWWLSTGVVLLLHKLPSRTHRWSFLGASLLTCVALYALTVTSAETTTANVYLAFFAAIVVWGWHELTFLQGMVTGPRRSACPDDARLGERFVLAVRTLLYHELALLATLGLILVLTWGQANQVAFWTFLALFCLRLSAKLNVFFGVPHLSEEFLPSSLDFLKSYFGRKPMNALFPLSVTVSTLVAAYVFHLAFAPDLGSAAAGGYMLVGSLIVLGTLEHWLLVLPLPDSMLWQWAVPKTDPSDRQPEGVVYRPGRKAGTSKTKGAPIAAVPSEGRFS